MEERHKILLYIVCGSIATINGILGEGRGLCENIQDETLTTAKPPFWGRVLLYMWQRLTSAEC